MNNFARFRHVCEQVYGQPWLITPGAHASIRQIIESRLLDVELKRPDGEDICGGAVKVAQMEIIDGIAHIPIGGVIGHKLSAFERGGGAVDVKDISNDIAEIRDNDEVQAVILDIDSPGGTTTGVPELADVIAELALVKTTYAFTDSMMASAAYFLAAGAEKIFATRSALVGSIGAYIVFFDESEAFAAQGVKVEIIKAGKLKAAGFPGTSLSKEERADLQAYVNNSYQLFADHVTANRDVKSETMQGQIFLGAQALERNLVDEIVASKADVVGQIVAASAAGES